MSNVDVVRFTNSIDAAKRRLEAAQIVKNAREVEKIFKEIKDLEKRRERSAGKEIR